MRLHVQLAPGPRPLFPAPPPLPSCTLFPTKKKNPFFLWLAFPLVLCRTFHISLRSLRMCFPSTCASLEGLLCQASQTLFSLCVCVCFFFYSFFLLLEKYIYVYIFFFCLDYALLALFEIISLPPGGGGCNVSALGWQCSGNISNGPRS